MTSGDIVVAKIAIVLALIGLCIGFYWGSKEDGIVGGIAFGLLGAVMIPFLAVCVCLIIGGIGYLFT